MKDEEKKAIVEGLLFASGDEGVTVRQLAEMLDLPPKEIRYFLDALIIDSKKTSRGIMIIQSKDVYHFATKPEHGEYHKMLLDNPSQPTLSQAALETLAIIAYKQPITRVEVEDIRGVNSDRSIKTLQARLLVKEVGRKKTIGKPILFGTTKEFLFYFGITSLTELPPLPQSVDDHGLQQETDLYFTQHKDDERK